MRKNRFVTGGVAASLLSGALVGGVMASPAAAHFPSPPRGSLKGCVVEKEWRSLRRGMTLRRVRRITKAPGKWDGAGDPGQHIRIYRACAPGLDHGAVKMWFTQPLNRRRGPHGHPTGPWRLRDKNVR